MTNIKPGEDGTQNNGRLEKDPYDFGQPKLTTWAASILLILIFLVFLGCVVIWAVVHPKTLEYTVENAVVTSFDLRTSEGTFADRNNVTNSFNITAVQNPNVTSYVNADFHFKMSVHNPNYRVSFTYSRMRADVHCNNAIIATEDVDGFFQGKKSTLLKSFTISARNGTLQLPASKDLVFMKYSRLYIRVDLSLTTNVTFTAPHWRPDHSNIEIYCADIMVQLLPFNSSSEQTRCTVQVR